MSKTSRRIEITAFRCKRVATTGAAPESTPQPSSPDVEEGLLEEIVALVKRMTSDPLESAESNCESGQQDYEH